jgi:uncharacterized ion transporter superfamily protein YfcC
MDCVVFSMLFFVVVSVFWVGKYAEKIEKIDGQSNERELKMEAALRNRLFVII